ncbi:hypothetical protein BC834DRAFT_970983 [Gloeopeniophorella convolvens]|nr:hypothetical protein BC834DRAFT_970983 [Gloeopeniophorella convolvens]
MYSLADLGPGDDDDATDELLGRIINSYSRAGVPPANDHASFIHGPALPSDPPDQLYDDFSGDLALDKPDLPPVDSPSMQGGLPSHIPESLIWDDVGDDSDNEPPVERESSPPGPFQDDDSCVTEPCHSHAGSSARPDAQIFFDGVEFTDDADWWPWQSREHCLIDVLGAFPRSAFSEADLDVVRWFAMKLGVRQLPTAHTVKRQRDTILSLAGTSPVIVKGTHGNVFSSASLARVLAHELSNPLVRPHLQFYPEEAPRVHTNAWHGFHWRHEIKAQLGCPMARGSDGQDYFVEEPALANINMLGTVAPVWINRWFERQGVLHAHELPLSAFFVSFPIFQSVHREYGLPHPSSIQGIICSEENGVPAPQEPYPVSLPNPWRVKANGRRVVALPIFLYLDDTSSNTSKKWNKHDSLLFVLAGLPQEQMLLPYNIHFLCTSNSAPPLEICERVCKELREAEADGVVAWDCELQEEVLLVPWDTVRLNICRMCKAKKIARDLASNVDAQLAHALEFMQGVPSCADNFATASGVKDKHLAFFHGNLKKIIVAQKELNRSLGRPLIEGVCEGVQRALEVWCFEDIINPLLTLEYLDLATDTPVEILHVILLGVVKYFWRDAVSRLDSQQKSLLKTRLSSLDVFDLGISTIRGHTLVQYVMSLTGRDFRVILQVAPAVLYGLLPAPAWKAWLALCRLAPLIFQPKFDSMTEYTERLETSIEDLLTATALWTVRWFNKPKFHILLHLPAHVKRFGPPLLTATEGFESFNHVIRLRSVLSNRQASSKDIGRSINFMHATCHLAGAGVLDLANDEEFARFLGIQAEWDVLEEDAHYRMPRIRPSADPPLYKLTRIEDVLCTAHSYHNCVRHQCDTTPTRRVRQEREEMDNFGDEIVHNTQPDDRIFNLAQLHNAQVLHAFRSFNTWFIEPRSELLLERLLPDVNCVQDDIQSDIMYCTSSPAQQFGRGLPSAMPPPGIPATPAKQSLSATKDLYEQGGALDSQTTDAQVFDEVLAPSEDAAETDSAREDESVWDEHECCECTLAEEHVLEFQVKELEGQVKSLKRQVQEKAWEIMRETKLAEFMQQEWEKADKLVVEAFEAQDLEEFRVVFEKHRAEREDPKWFRYTAGKRESFYRKKWFQSVSGKEAAERDLEGAKREVQTLKAKLGQERVDHLELVNSLKRQIKRLCEGVSSTMPGKKPRLSGSSSRTPRVIDVGGLETSSSVNSLLPDQLSDRARRERALAQQVDMLVTQNQFNTTERGLLHNISKLSANPVDVFQVALSMSIEKRI